MENLLKEQISCMKKMLYIVQDGKDNTTSTSISKKKNLSDNDYLDLDSDIESNIHFEESFNVTNISNSVDYLPESEVVNSCEKDYDNKLSNSNNHRFEILLKPFEKNKKNENAVDEDPQRISGTQNPKTQNMNKDLNQLYLNKEKDSKHKPTSNVNFNATAYSKNKTGKKIDHSYRANQNKNY